MKCSAKTFFDLWRSLIIGLFSKSTVEDRFEANKPHIPGTVQTFFREIKNRSVKTIHFLKRFIVDSQLCFTELTIDILIIIYQPIV